MASRLLSTFESAGLAATATFASVLWIGLALPGLPLLPGVGGGQNSNVAISLSSAVLGVQDSRTFAPSSGVAGRQARLLSLLLPAKDTLGNELATQRPGAARSGASMVVALPPPPARDTARSSGPRVTESSQLASTGSAPAPSPPAPAPPRPPVSSPPPRVPDPDPQTPAPPTLPIDPPLPSDPVVPSAGPPEAGETPPIDAGSADTTTPPDPGKAPAGGNGNGNAGGNNPNAGGADAGGNGNGNAGGNNPNAGGNNPNRGGANAGGNGNDNGNGNGNAGGNNPNAGGANAGGNGNGNGSGAPKGTPKKGP